MKHIYKNTSASLAIAFFFLFNTACLQNLHALDKTAILTGTWNNAAIWLPTGVPASTDNAIISIGVTVTLTSSQSIAAVTVNTGGTLILSSGYTLTMNGALTVNGTMDMNDGNITQNTNLAPFVIGSTGVFEWEPGTNTLGAASLFTRSVESFATTSTLKIKRWYDYTNVPLGSVVTGHFGNLVMNSQTGSNIYEWNQNNKFETHEILGTLTIDQGWITLDRSGSISNTTIGNIVLLSANSSLYLLRGNHAGSFLLNTNSVTITNGTLYGLLDGTGNVTINVGGNFTTSGNFKLVYNDGVLNTGNGNGTLNISGTYSQSAGDTRLMYNISTTNSGVFTFTVGNVLFTGGIFMGQYGCHNLNQACIFSVTSNLTINFSNSSDVFRGCGLTSLSGYMNTAQLNFSVGGNFTITANSNGSEFTSAAAAGGENIVISGNMSVSGGKISFNYGFPTASHDVVFVLTGNMTVSGGVFNLSKHLGQGMYTINGNLTLSSGGLLAIKGDDG
ncbi:MAG: hypothetical protein JJE25_06765, partial [Bacteroidia bacterium]|nr:hypothetical protein [Bacteroidia bacterium]